MTPPALWINGPFGVGKTHTACALRERLPGSFLFDPEEVGFALRKLTPGFSGDFQEHPLWPGQVLEALVHAAAVADGPVIVPMTVTHAGRHELFVKGLRARGVTVHHFTLMAPPEVIRRRLRRRMEGRHSWAAQQVEARLRDLQGEQFAIHLNTAGVTTQALAQQIAARAGLTLRPVQADPLRWIRTTLAFRR